MAHRQEYIVIGLTTQVPTPLGQIASLLFMRSQDAADLTSGAEYVKLGDMTLRASNILSVATLSSSFKFEYEKHPNPYKESPVIIAQVA